MQRAPTALAMIWIKIAGIIKALKDFVKRYGNAFGIGDLLAHIRRKAPGFRKKSVDELSRCGGRARTCLAA